MSRLFVFLLAPKFVLSWRILLIVMIGLELYVSLIPVDLDDVDIPSIDKILHFTMHAGNVALASLAFPNQRRFIYAGVLLFCLGPLIELLQGQLPHRQASWEDQLANTLGFIAGLWFVRRFLR